VPTEEALASLLPGRAPHQVRALHALLAGDDGGRGEREPQSRGALRLVPARAVHRAARRLAGFTTWPWLLGAFLSGALGYAAGLVALRGSGLDPQGPPGLAAAALLVVLTALIHEFGHAAALADAGYPPGSVGAGLLVLLPVLYCDVTAVALLPGRARLRIDAAGAAWQLAAGGAMALAAAGVGSRVFPPSAWAAGAAAILKTASLGVLAAAVWSLLPLPRSDGCWLACDALGVRDLDAPAHRGRGGRVQDRRRLAWLWGLRGLHILFFSALAGAALVQLRRLEPALAGCSPLLRAAGRVGLAVVGTVVAAVALRRAWRLLRAALADAGRL